MIEELNKENLEKVCILDTYIRTHPTSAFMLSKYFGLNLDRIQEGWLFCSSPRAYKDPDWLLKEIEKLFK